jgi:hypothetical protein
MRGLEARNVSEMQLPGKTSQLITDCHCSAFEQIAARPSDGPGSSSSAFSHLGDPSRRRLARLGFICIDSKCTGSVDLFFGGPSRGRKQVNTHFKFYIYMHFAVCFFIAFSCLGARCALLHYRCL